MLVDSLLVGRVNAPTLERLDQELDRLQALPDDDPLRRSLVDAAGGPRQLPSG
jgi:hypothetical protein